MQLLIKIYNRLLTFFKRSASKEANNTDNNQIGSISFNLYDNSDIDIICSIPNIDNIDTENIATISEKYATFLCHINDGNLIDSILNILIDQKKCTESEKGALFLDNVLFFWALTHAENQKTIKKNEKTGQPMVKPMDVFKL